MQAIRRALAVPLVLALLIGFGIGRCADVAAAEPESFWSGWEVVSELSVGWKLNDYSDSLFHSDCVRAEVVTPRDFRPWRHKDDCGGHNLIYAGYPVAVVKQYPWGYVKGGWFHFSSWFDGGNSIFGSLESGENGRAELDFNCLPCVTVGFNWTRWYRNR